MAESTGRVGRDATDGLIPAGSVDRAGRGDRPASWTPLVIYAIVAVAVVLVGLRWVHTVAGGMLLLVLVVGLSVALLVVSTVRLVGFVSRSDRGVLTEAEREALGEPGDAGVPETPLAQQARSVLALGPMLGRPVREWHARGAGAGLTEDELSVIEGNRVAEAARTSAWLSGQRDVEQVEMMAADGIVLRAHVFHVDRLSNRWAILAHGYRGHWTEMLLYARSYARHGFNLLIPELRGHRESGGRYLGLGYLDASDLVEWSRWIAREQDEGARIVLHGHSMGGTAACMAAGDKTLPSGVVAAVADSAYSDAWNMARRTMRALGWPIHPMLEFARLGFSLLDEGYDIARASAVEAVAHAQVPMLYLQGELDPIVAPYMAKRLYDETSGSATGGNHRLCMFPRAGHGEASLADPRRYWHEVFSFVDKRCVQGVAKLAPRRV